MSYYKCENCGRIIDEYDLEEKTICMEEYYGVGGMFGSSTTSKVGCCPYCHEVELEEIGDYEMADMINDLLADKRKLKKEIKELVEKCKSLGIDL